MEQLLKQHEEFIRYALFGIAAVAVDVLVYALTADHLGVRLSNAASWLSALIVAFIANKYRVFHRGKEGFPQFLRELFEFTTARLAGLLIQVWGTDALIRKGFQRSLLGIRGGAAKLFTTALVIVLNYLFSKFLVFCPREVQS